MWDKAEPGIGLFVDGGFCGLTAAECEQLFPDAPAPEAPIQLFPDAPAPEAPIQLWELFAVVAMVRLYGPYLSGQYWQLGVDNANMYSWLSKGTVRGPVWGAFAAALRVWLRHQGRSSASGGAAAGILIGITSNCAAGLGMLE